MNFLLIYVIIGIVLFLGFMLARTGLLADNTLVSALGIGLIILGIVIYIICSRYRIRQTDDMINEKIYEIKQNVEKELQEQELARQMIENGANVYIDGQLVDANKIILDDYNATVVNDYVILSD